MRFKKLFESLDGYEKFLIKKNKHRWTFTNLENKKVYYIDIDKTNYFDSLGYFLNDIDAKDINGNSINHSEFTSNFVQGLRNAIYIKSDSIAKIASTWSLK